MHTLNLKDTTAYEDAQLEEVRSWRSVKGERAKLCPFVDCGKSFSRSLDLGLHFRFEVRERAYTDWRLIQEMQSLWVNIQEETRISGSFGGMSTGHS